MIVCRDDNRWLYLANNSDARLEVNNLPFSLARKFRSKGIYSVTLARSGGVRVLIFPSSALDFPNYPAGCGDSYLCQIVLDLLKIPAPPQGTQRNVRVKVRYIGKAQR